MGSACRKPINDKQVNNSPYKTENTSLPSVKKSRSGSSGSIDVIPPSSAASRANKLKPVASDKLKGKDGKASKQRSSRTGSKTNLTMEGNKNMSIDNKKHETVDTSGILEMQTLDILETSVSALTSRGCDSKPNQDAFCLIENFGDRAGDFFFGVFDGHGTNGHQVSRFAKNVLPRLLDAEIKALGADKAFQVIGKRANQAVSNSGYDVRFSGTTASFGIIHVDGTCTFGNIGDSRTIIISDPTTPGAPLKTWTTVREHRPELEDEAARIRKKGGRVCQAVFDCVTRVWPPNSFDMGLAMSRSLGDSFMHGFGVNPNAEYSTYTLKPEDRFIVCATDGLWEFCENPEVSEIAKTVYDRPGGGLCESSKALAARARELWMENEGISDDTTVIVIDLRKFIAARDKQL